MKHKHGHDILEDNPIDEKKKTTNAINVIAFVQAGSTSSSIYSASNATLIAPVNEDSVYSTFSTNASIKSETVHSNDIFQHSQIAEKVIVAEKVIDFVNVNFPDANFPKHSTEKSANASNKKKY